MCYASRTEDLCTYVFIIYCIYTTLKNKLSRYLLKNYNKDISIVKIFDNNIHYGSDVWCQYLFFLFLLIDKKWKVTYCSKIIIFLINAVLCHFLLTKESVYNVPIYSMCMCMYINGTTGLKAQLKKKLLFTAPKIYNCRKNIYVVLNINGATDFVWK